MRTTTTIDARMMEWTLEAPAKINLGLEILRRRDDGYHDINTLFLAIDLCDTIHLRFRDDGVVALAVHAATEDRVADLGPEEDNLCVRAARMLRDSLGNDRLGLDIRLEKRIPVGAGLGGGSSDAAAVLRGAAGLWGEVTARAIDPAVIEAVASRLGSDVPFFLRGGLAVASGRGERLTALTMALPYVAVLVNPGIHVPTPWAYAAVGRTGERPAGDLPRALRDGMGIPGEWAGSLVNDFEPALFDRHPEIGEIKRQLSDAGAELALMSGSGSTVFGLFGDAELAAAAAGRFERYWHAVARPLVAAHEPVKSSAVLRQSEEHPPA